MESLVLRSVLSECRSLVGRIVSGVDFYPDKPGWVLKFRGSGNLVIDLDGAGPVLYRMAAADPADGAARPGGGRERKRETRTGPATLLEERLTGAHAIGFEPWGLNRLALMTFEKRDRFGDSIPTVLVVELFGAWGNLIVLDGPAESGRIVDRLRADRRREGGRGLDRGQRYTYPDRNRADLMLDGPAALVRRLEAPPLPDTPALWVKRFQETAEGTGKATARDVVARTPEPITAAGLVDTWQSLVQSAWKGDGAWIVTRPGEPPRVMVHPPLADEESVVVPCPTASAALAELRGRSAETAAKPDGGWLDLSRTIARRLETASRLVARLRAELVRRPDAALARLRGETLLASADQVGKGMAEVTVPSPHGDGDVTIPLDPSVTVMENARRYFREARKAELAAADLPARIATAEDALARVENWSRALSAIAVDDEAAIARLREEVGGRRRDAGKAKPGGPARQAAESSAGRPNDRDRTPTALQPRRYDLPGGWVILVGRSQAGNDYLTHRLAAPHDLWFHAHGAAGSHVILKAPDRKAQADRSLLVTAAALAALNSKARHASRVPVVYAEKRHVRKPRGSKPGLAAVTNEKSIMVKPAEPAGIGDRA
jgi:predicted ribosome quality control (RQC) complex YloA/Tae2 family protein